jgi:hypothetical protein
MGEEEFFFVLFPLLFWCVDFALGVRLTATFLISIYVNFWLKDLFAHPRPFQLDPAVKLLDIRGYGLPSGHAESAVVGWGVIAAWFNKAWSWIIAILLMLLIGFSRVYLGVHFPTDVLGGWAIGGIFLLVYLTLAPRIEAWLKKSSLAVQLILAAAVPLLLMLFHNTDYRTSPMALLIGIGTGTMLSRRIARFNAAGPLWQRGARLLIGAMALFVLHFGLRQVFPAEGERFYLIMRFVRYTLIGLWMSLGAPLLFLRMRLASSINNNEGDSLPEEA